MAETKWNASLYDQKHAFVFEYGKSLLSQLNPQPGEHILDLGCGTGHLTQAISETGARVVGIDSAPDMIATARQQYPTIEFYVMDARNFTFPTPFDAVFSNAALHWIPEADAVARCIVASLRPGGRLVIEMGGKNNVALIISALQAAIHEVTHTMAASPWYFPSIGEYASLLEHHGLEVESAILFDRPTTLEDGPQGLHNWLTMFAEGMLRQLSPQQQQQVLTSMEDRLRPALFQDDHWVADYRRLRIHAFKRAETRS